MNIIKRCKYGLMIFNLKDVWQGKSFDVYGEYSESEVKLFEAVIKPGDTVLDIGANIGSHTIVFSRLVGQNGVVMAFEPERLCFYTLAGNIAINNLRNTFCYHQAISSVSGVMNVPELDYEMTTNWGGMELDHDYSQHPHYPVAVNSLDNLGMTKCDFIKIDVEGMEKTVLEGGVNTIQKLKPTMCIEDDRENKSAPLREFIKSLGYKMYLHEAYLFNPANFFENNVNVFANTASANLLCIPLENQCPVDLEKFGLKQL